MLTVHLGAAPCHQELNGANNSCGLAQSTMQLTVLVFTLRSQGIWTTKRGGS